MHAIQHAMGYAAPSRAHSELDAQAAVMPRACEKTAPLRKSRRSGPTFADLRGIEAGEGSAQLLSGRYLVTELIARGGMSPVFGGVDLTTKRAIAVKVLGEDHGNDAGGIARFLGEARLSTEFDHPNIVAAPSFGSTMEGLVYLVMERLEGEDLQRTLAREGRLSWARCRALLLQVCAGLAAIHRRGYVHCDVKPANCVCVRDAEGNETLKLIDFGIAAPVGVAGRSGAWSARLGSRIVAGTRPYMSPEQARGAQVDARSDVYAVGVLLAQLLTGRLPGTTGRLREDARGRVRRRGAPAREALAAPQLGVDPRVRAVYERAVARDPAARFSSMDELAAALAAIPPGAQRASAPAREPKRRRAGASPGWRVWVAVALAGLALACAHAAPTSASARRWIDSGELPSALLLTIR